MVPVSGFKASRSLVLGMIGRSSAFTKSSVIIGFELDALRDMHMYALSGAVLTHILEVIMRTAE